MPGTPDSAQHLQGAGSAVLWLGPNQSFPGLAVSGLSHNGAEASQSRQYPPFCGSRLVRNLPPRCPKPNPVRIRAVW